MDMAAAPTLTSASHPASSPRRPAVLLACVIVLTFAVYAATLRYEFVYDDIVQVAFNPNVKAWTHLPRLFAEHVWANQPQAQAQYYRPVFMTWCLLQFKLFGLRPGLWHFGAVLLHLLATVLVFRVAAKLLADDLAAAIAALLFGLHPVHLENVAWVSGATDPLMAIFLLGSFLSYLRFREGGQWRWLALSLVQYALACLSKETGVVLPAMIAVYECLAPPASFGARLRRTVLAVIPYLAVAALYLAQRWTVLHALGRAQMPLPPAKVPLSWPAILWFYISKLVWPAQLALFHGMRPVLVPTWENFWQPLLFVLLAFASAALLIRRLPTARDGDHPSLRAVGWLSMTWILIPLLPVLDVLLLEKDEIVHDRYLYLPSIGFVVLIAIAIRRLRLGRARSFGWPAAQLACAVLLATGMAVATAQQSSHWATDILLYYRAMQVAPGSLTAATALGNTLLARNFTEEGIRIFEQIARSNPTNWPARFQLGNAYYKVGRFRESEEQLATAVRLNPSAPQILVHLATAQMKNEHFAAAEQTVRQAIAVQPSAPGGHYVLGVTLEKQGRWTEAAAAFEQELALDPNQPAVRTELEAARSHRR